MAKAVWRTAWWVAMAALAAAPGRADGQEARPVIALTWHDPVRALPFPDGLLADEIQALLEPTGLELGWASAAPEAVATGSLHVVLMGSEPAGSSEVMGSVRRGSPSRTAWINLPSVERALGLRRRADRPILPGEAQALRRALSRVIAHELVHLLAPDLPHTRGGLMEAKLGRPFLTAPHVSLPPTVAEALRTVVSREELGARPVALAERY